jgi:hypothetical protein
MTEINTTTPQVWKREEQCKIFRNSVFFIKVFFSIQGVSRVIQFSSQYNDSTWSANQVIGPPKVYPRYGKKNFQL